MKPSAMKNELNAVLHFVCFLKQSRNLAARDAPFNATTENVKMSCQHFRSETHFD